jgi:hypothetical protein
MEQSSSNPNDEEHYNEEEHYSIEPSPWDYGFNFTSETILEELSTFTLFLESHAKYDKERSVTATNRMVKLVLWTWKQIEPGSSTREGIRTVRAWLKLLFIEHCHLLRKFTEFIVLAQGTTPETTRHYCLNAQHFLEWFHGPQLPKSERPCKSKHLKEAKELLKTLMSECRAHRKRHRSDNATIQQLQKSKHLPAGGLPEFRQLFGPAIAEILEAATALKLAINICLHQRLLSTMFAAMYVFSAQGRIGAFSGLKFSQVEELLNRSFVVSDKFKTRSTYGYQPIIVPREVQPMLMLYLEVRASIIGSTASVAPELFLNIKGEAVINAGRLVANFFSLRGYNTTSNDLRALMEMSTRNALNNNQITREQSQAHQLINGHSSATTEDFYLKDDVNRAVALAGGAAAAMQQQVPGPPAGIEPTQQMHYNHLPAPTTPPVHRLTPHNAGGTPPIQYPGFHVQNAYTSYAPVPWGKPTGNNVGHPQYEDRTVTRVRWSPEELHYIGWWVSLHTTSDTLHVASKLLQHLLNTPMTWPIFHERHAKDSSRMRTGIEAEQRESERERERERELNRSTHDEEEMYDAADIWD